MLDNENYENQGNHDDFYVSDERSQSSNFDEITSNFTPTNSHGNQSDYNDSSNDISPRWSYQSIINRLLSVVVSFIIPLTLGSVVLFITFISSIFFARYLRTNFIPQAVFNQEIYFDFQSVPYPKSIIKFGESPTDFKQWDFLKNTEKINFPSWDTKYLQRGANYDIYAEFKIPYAHDNINLGSFMTRITTIDSTGDVTAKSLRHVSIPYRSTTTLLLDSFLLYPFRLLKLDSAEEVAKIKVSLLPHFIEPISSERRTSFIEIEILQNKLYIQNCELSIIPIFTGISYYLYNYPYASTVFVVFTTILIQWSIIGLVVFVSLRYILIKL